MDIFRSFSHCMQGPSLLIMSLAHEALLYDNERRVIVVAAMNEMGYVLSA
jgi:hypothetical protein